IGIDGFTRSNVAKIKRSADGGVGVFRTRKGAPTKVIGGVSASWNEEKSGSHSSQDSIFEQRRLSNAERIAQPEKSFTKRLSRTRLHSLSFDYFAGFGRAEKIQENLRSLDILCPRH